MMQFVRYPKFFIVFSIVKHSLINVLFFKFIDYLNFVKVDHCTIRGTTRDISNNIGLNTDTHLNKFLKEGYPEMNARLG